MIQVYGIRNDFLEEVTSETGKFPRVVILLYFFFFNSKRRYLKVKRNEDRVVFLCEHAHGPSVVLSRFHDWYRLPALAPRVFLPCSLLAGPSGIHSLFLQYFLSHVMCLFFVGFTSFCHCLLIWMLSLPAEQITRNLVI